MSWSIGYDTQWARDVGYGVPAYCDHPGCDAAIDRGLSYVCGGEMYGGEHPKLDHPDWIKHKLTDESWKEWREQNEGAVKAMVGV